MDVQTARGKLIEVVNDDLNRINRDVCASLRNDIKSWKLFSDIKS